MLARIFTQNGSGDSMAKYKILSASGVSMKFTISGTSFVCPIPYITTSAVSEALEDAEEYTKVTD